MSDCTIPRDMLAQIHEGGAVDPEKYNPLRFLQLDSKAIVTLLERPTALRALRRAYRLHRKAINRARYKRQYARRASKVNR